MKQITMILVTACLGLFLNVYSQIDSPFGPGVIPSNICGAGSYFPVTYWCQGYMSLNVPQGFPSVPSNGYQIKFSEHRITQITGLPVGVIPVTDVMASAVPGAPYGIWHTNANGLASGVIKFDVELGSINSFLSGPALFTAIISVEHKLSAVLDPSGQPLTPLSSGPFQYGEWYPYGAVNGDGIAPLSPFSLNVYTQECVFFPTVSTVPASCSYNADGSATITVSNIQLPLVYSIDNGLTSDTISSNSFTISGLAPGQYTIVGKDSDFKLFRSTFTVGVAQYPDIVEPLCMVTVDEATGRNMLVWERSGAPHISGYNIYKLSNQTSNFEIIGTVDSSQQGLFIDTTGNPNQSSAQYAMTTIAVKTCDTLPSEGPLSSPHQTIHLSANMGVNGEVNLIWNTYNGFSYPNFEIQRSTNSSPFYTVGSVANTFLSYTDMFPPQGTNFYRINIEKAGGCDPSKSYTGVRSNVVDGNGNPASVNAIENTVLLSVFPNPSDGLFTITCQGKYDIKIADYLGRTIFSKTSIENHHSLDLRNQPAGLYFIILYQDDKVVGKSRIVKN